MGDNVDDEVDGETGDDDNDNDNGVTGCNGEDDGK